MQIIIEIENNKEGRALLSFLKHLPFVKIREAQKSKRAQNFEEIFGIWKNRDITKEKLRDKAWRM
ncbi:hypothetical protein Calab_1166 [Caldithrix abyssi DSM 13497]|uniref:Uncharacterized protein n=1 Tax=Caldithrix abyssi DSM 13497 TaxID=880073 RepID=H1XX57_CALAY|nr:hypothetical protein [Caldithrix abyssi]APF20708.1 hypothetical protein Cabys_3963 [Caldithrix abyssi DSM 13497]EHO40794.1 hypothetical protein Calab_1166 [Caldithrix abyssi DSM 13497]